MNLNPLVVDVSRYEVIADFHPARDFGIRGVIGKATEGLSYVDRAYAKYRRLAADAGLLWGAYHFFRPGNVESQLAHFLAVAEPDDRTLLALDHEDDRVSAAAAHEFLDRLWEKTGRVPVLYSGNTIKEQLGSRVDPFFARTKLWLAQYSKAGPAVQRSWTAPWLWQFTGDGVGLEPHNVPGIAIPGGKGIDINHYDGTPEQLAADWPGAEKPKPSVPVASEPSASEHDVKWLQAALNAAGAMPPLFVDGVYGPRTQRAVKNFQAGSGLEADGAFGPLTDAALIKYVARAA